MLLKFPMVETRLIVFVTIQFLEVCIGVGYLAWCWNDNFDSRPDLGIILPCISLQTSMIAYHIISKFQDVHSDSWMFGWIRNIFLLLQLPFTSRGLVDLCKDFAHNDNCSQFRECEGCHTSHNCRDFKLWILMINKVSGFFGALWYAFYFVQMLRDWNQKGKFNRHFRSFTIEYKRSKLSERTYQEFLRLVEETDGCKLVSSSRRDLINFYVKGLLVQLSNQTKVKYPDIAGVCQECDCTFEPGERIILERTGTIPPAVHLNCVLISSTKYNFSKKKRISQICENLREQLMVTAN